MEKILKHYQEIAKYWENLANHEKEEKERWRKKALELEAEKKNSKVESEDATVELWGFLDTIF